jgi:hypothetical protein
MKTATDTLFDVVAGALTEAELIAWDGCHKIYVAMDPIEAAWFNENYEHVMIGTSEEMLETVVDWFNRSCGLRFVSAVSHDEEDPNSGFMELIPQFAETDDEDDEY